MSRSLRFPATLALLLLALALVEAQFHFVQRLFRPGPLAERELATQGLGQYLAAHYPGKRAIVLSNPFSNQPGQPAEVYRYEKAGLRGLRRGLGKTVPIEQVVFPELKPGVLRNPHSVFIDPRTTTPLSYLVPETALDKVAQAYPNAELVVSLIGLPVNIQRAEVWKIERKHRFALLFPDLALLGGSDEICDAMKAGKISALVLNKPGVVGSELPVDRDSRIEFDRRFLLITPENVHRYVQTYPGLFEPRVTN